MSLFSGNAVLALLAALMVLGSLLPAPSGAGGSGTDGAAAFGSSDGAPAAVPRAAERPDHDGPHAAGYLYKWFKGATKTYAVKVKIFYPAATSAENATADLSGAPYPTVVQLPPMGGTEEVYNASSPRVASWGFVLVVVGVNWSDRPNSGNVSDVEELLDILEADNATPSARLSGMVDRQAFGISGWSAGGALSLVDGTYIGRLKAVQALAPALASADIDVLAQTFRKPFQVQCGQNDGTYRQYSVYSYQKFPAPKAFLDITNGAHGGPFCWDAFTSFFQVYLKGAREQETFLYGTGAMDDIASSRYELHFLLANGTFFPPAIAVSASPGAVNESEPVAFSITSDGYLPAGHPRGAFAYDFESDGMADCSDKLNSSALHSYVTSGTKRVAMWFALGSYRMNANNTPSVLVANLPPTISISGNLSGIEDEMLRFEATGRDTPNDLPGLRYSWAFGDNTGTPFSADNSTSHTYTRSGNYTIRPFVKDDDGVTISTTATVSIANLPPTAGAGPDIEALMDEEIALAGRGGDTPSDLKELLYMWEFGDGSSSEWNGNPQAAHAYNSSGNFTVRLLVKDNDGAAATDTLAVRVGNVPPGAQITAPLEGSALQKDEEVEFKGSGTDTAGDLSALMYRWAFGDGNTSEWSKEARAKHTYTSGGRMTARLQVRDRAGALAGAAVNLTVRNQAPDVRLTSPAPAAEAREDETVQFAAEGTDTASDQELLNYTWDVDGAAYFGASLRLKFTTEGQRSFKVTVRDPEGASAEASGTIIVNNQAPRVSADISPRTLFVNDSIDFTATVQDTASDLPALKVRWDLGDGAYCSTASGKHVYTKAGSYKVQLTVEDDEGARARQEFSVRVDARPAVQPEPQGGPPARAAISPAILAAGAGAAAAIVVAVALVMLRRRRMHR